MKKIINIFLTVAFLVTYLFNSDSSFSTYAATDTSKDVSNNNTSLWPIAPSIDSDAAILMDLSTGTILYEKNMNDKHYPASTTKILTAITAIENSKLNETVTFSHDVIANLESGATHIGIKENEQLNMKDCLYALLVASANEVALGIAEHVGGSQTNFAAMMNDTAKKIGCNNSNFSNPTGLYDSNLYTTCYDLALISQYAYNNNVFSRIIGTKNYTIDTTNITNEKRVFSNTHQMLMGNKAGFTQYLYKYCLGGKTGYTSQSNHVLVTYASNSDITLICVIMNTSATAQYSDSIKLFDYGFNNFKMCNVSSSDELSSINNNSSDFFNRYYNISKSDDAISVDSKSKILFPNSINYDDIKKEITYFDDINIIEGINTIGKIHYSYDGLTLGETDIYYIRQKNSSVPNLSLPDTLSSKKNTDVSNSDFKNKIMKISIYISIGLAFILILIIIILLINKHKNNKKKKIRRMVSREDFYMRSKKKSKGKYKF